MFLLIFVAFCACIFFVALCCVLVDLCCYVVALCCFFVVFCCFLIKCLTLKNRKNLEHKKIFSQTRVIKNSLFKIATNVSKKMLRIKVKKVGKKNLIQNKKKKTKKEICCWFFLYNVKNTLKIEKVLSKKKIEQKYIDKKLVH